MRACTTLAAAATYFWCVPCTAVILVVAEKTNLAVEMHADRRINLMESARQHDNQPRPEHHALQGGDLIKEAAKDATRVGLKIRYATK